MKTRWHMLFGLLLLLGVSPSLKAADADVVLNGKRATALVQIGQAGFSNAFCVSSDGLFVTDRRAAALPRGQKLKVVVSPAEDGERVYDADIVATSSVSDLVLLHVTDGKDLTALSLGDEKTLLETQPVTAFGYPVGKTPQANSVGYPSISVNSAKITSLRHQTRQLVSIQIDAMLNPGNAGGPLLDASGKVVGVITRGAEDAAGAAGTSLAIPVNKLREFIDVPRLLVAAPNIAFGQRFSAADFSCNLFGIGANRSDLKVELTLESLGAPARRLEMAPRPDGSFGATAPPVIKGDNASPMLSASALAENGLVEGWIADHSIRVGNQSAALSRIRSIELTPTPRITTADDQTIEGELADLGQLVPASHDGIQSPPIDLKRIIRVQIDPASTSDSTVGYRAFARQGDKVLVQAAGSIRFNSSAGDDSAVVETIDASLLPPADPAVQTLRLPRGIDISKVCGSGNLLLVHLSAWRMFVVIDLHAGTILSTVPIDEENVLAAAGADDLVVGIPASRELRRYNLRSGKLLLASKFEPPLGIEQMEMGASATGPLLIRTEGNAKWFYDVPTLQHMTMKWGAADPSFTEFRASPDGATFNGWGGGSEYRFHTWNNEVTGRLVRHDSGEAFPNFDGSMLCGVTDVLGHDLSVLLSDPAPHRFFPTWSPGLIARLSSDERQGHTTLSGELLAASDRKTLCALPAMPEMETTGPSAAKLQLDQRLMLFPADNLIVSVPQSDDRVILRKFDFEQAISKSAAKQMYVRTPPPMRFVEGSEYSYALQIGGGTAPLKYHLDTGPKGMKISNDGRVTWAAPAVVASDELPVQISVTDAGGARLAHGFTLQAERNPPGHCPRLRPDGSAIPQSVREEFEKRVASLGHGGDDAVTSFVLVEMCLMDIGEPELALPFCAKAKPELARIATLATKPFSEISEDEAIELAKWYLEQSGQVDGKARQIGVRNTWLYWNQWLLRHEADDAQRADIDQKAMMIAAPFGIDLFKSAPEDLFVLMGICNAGNGGLRIEGDVPNSRVQFPTRITGSYRMHVEFTADAGLEADIMLPMGFSDEGLLVLGAFGGRATFTQMPTLRQIRSRFGDFPMQLNHRYGIDALVRVRDDRLSIVAYGDGAQLTSWSGKKGEVRLPPGWGVARPGSLGVGTQGTRVQFHVATLYPLERDMFVYSNPGLSEVPPMGAKTDPAELSGDGKYSAEPDESPRIVADAALWKQAAAAAAQDQRGNASATVGSRRGKSFAEFPAGGGVLVGLRLTLGVDQDDWHVQSLQGIFLKSDGTRVLGERHGELGPVAEEYFAPPGYAISVMRAAGESMVDGFDLASVRLKENGPDPGDVVWEGVWHGRSKPRGDRQVLGRQGKPIIGLAGRTDTALQALGIYSAP